MLIETRSLVSGIIRTLDLSVTETQIEAWESGMNLDSAMPNLTDIERNFIQSSVIDFNMNPVYKEYIQEDEFDYFSD